MGTYFIYHCSVSEVDVDADEVRIILEAHTTDSTVPRNKEDALTELRDIIDSQCQHSLIKEIERLNRVVAVLDQRLASAATVPV